MGTLLLGIALVLCVLGLAILLLNIKYAHEKALIQMNREQESQYEIQPYDIVTAENLQAILEWQMAKAQGDVKTDHPAIAARKAQG
jgi:hypothetical protein